jgi:hypothetical protein
LDDYELLDPCGLLDIFPEYFTVLKNILNPVYTMAHITTVSHGNYASVPRRSYISTAAFNTDIFSYSTAQVNGTYVGTLAVLAAATAANCPQGRTLHETGKKLFPGANNGVNDYLVSVYDPLSMLTGFINPNDTVFSLMNTDRANFFLDGPNGTGTGLSAPARANPLYTRGDILAGGRLDISGNALIYGNISDIRAVNNIADGGSMVVNAAQIADGIVTATLTAARTITTGTAVSIVALLGTAVGTTIEFTYINLAATHVATLAGGTGVTIVGAAAVAGSSSARFLVTVASATTVFVYRA